MRMKNTVLAHLIAYHNKRENSTLKWKNIFSILHHKRRTQAVSPKHKSKICLPRQSWKCILEWWGWRGVLCQLSGGCVEYCCVWSEQSTDNHYVTCRSTPTFHPHPTPQEYSLSISKVLISSTFEYVTCYLKTLLRAL